MNYTDEIGSSYNTIKKFVAETYNEGVSNGEAPSFVVLFGDTPQIPATVSGETQHVTDLYYGSVDGDIYPEMYFSRMCCETTGEMQSLIEKILVYEQYTMEDPSYLNNVLLIAGADEMWNPKVGQPTIKYGTKYYYNYEHGFDNVYDYLSFPYDGCYDHLNEGVASVNYTAHGSYQAWTEPEFSVYHANNLANEGKYFLAIGNCCDAANYGYNDVCLAESMIRGFRKGAFSYIGAAPPTNWFEDYYYSVGAHNFQFGDVPTYEESSRGSFDALFEPKVFNTVGAINFSGNLAVSYAHEQGIYPTHNTESFYWQAYNVLGDASIMPYLSEPIENNISHSESINIGWESFTVSADPLSIVALSKNGELLGTGIVGDNGIVEVPITQITSTEDIDLVITCPQRIPYITTLSVESSEDAFLSVLDYSLDGDGILSFGETTNLSLNIKNIGLQATTSNSTITLSCESNNITINNGTVTCNNIDPDQTITVDGFNFTVSENIENGEQFNFLVTITNGNKTWENNFIINGYKPIIIFDDFESDDLFNGGTIVPLTVKFKNVGGFKASNVQISLNSSNPNITISESTQNIGTIGKDEYGVATFDVHYNEDVLINSKIDFTTIASGDNGLITCEENFTLTNKCNIVFKLYDEFGDGWNGYGHIMVMFDDGTPTQNLTIHYKPMFKDENSSSNDPNNLRDSEATYIIPVNIQTEVTIAYVEGLWDSENSFEVFYENNPSEIIYEVQGPSGGILHTFICNCTDEKLIMPIKNLMLSIIGDSEVKLTWEHHEPEMVDYYIIYRDGAEIGTSETLSYTDNNVSEGLHTYCVAASYTNGKISDKVCDDIEFGIACNPIRNLNITTTNNKAVLTWKEPSLNSSQEVDLSWSFDFSNNSVGTGNQADFDVAHRYEVSDLTNYVGWHLTKVTFYPNTDNCEYSIRAWIGANAENMVLDQLVREPNIQAETVVEVEGNVVIEPNKEFWVGYRCNTLSGYPAGIDFGPAISGKGDMLKFSDDDWISISTDLDGFNNNFVIVATIANGKGEVANITLQDDLNRKGTGVLEKQHIDTNEKAYNYNSSKDIDFLYSIYKDGVLIGTTEELTFTDNDVEDGTFEYCVGVEYGTCVAEQVCKEVTISIGIEDSKNIVVYPNPTNNIVNIDGIIVNYVYVYNNVGQLVDKVQNNQINVSNYAKGIYTLNILSIDGNSYKAKIVVQ